MKKYSFVAILLVILISSCKKNNTKDASETQVRPTAFLNAAAPQYTYDDYDVVVTLSASGQMPSTLNPDFELLGSFRDGAKGALIPIDNFTASSKVIRINSANNLYQANIMPSSSESGDFARMFGTASSFAAVSSRLGNFSKNLYVPAIVNTDLSSNPSVLSKLSNVTVNWNADASNPNPVGILVWYQGNSILNTSLSLPTGNITYFKTAPDNGQFTIPSSALTNIPTNGFVTITVARGIQNVFAFGSRKGVITAATYSVSEPKQVVQ